MSIQRHVFLRRNAGLCCNSEPSPLGDTDLGFDDVEPSDDLGDRVLHLDTRIHFDEIELACVGIHQEFDRTGSNVVRGLTDSQCRLTKVCALSFDQIRRWRTLNDLLVPSLDRAITLEQMHQVAMGIAEKLHFHVACALNEFLEIDLILAESALGLAPRAVDGVEELALAVNWPHTASTPAP